MVSRQLRSRRSAGRRSPRWLLLLQLLVEFCLSVIIASPFPPVLHPSRYLGASPGKTCGGWMDGWVGDYRLAFAPWQDRNHTKKRCNRIALLPAGKTEREAKRGAM